MVGKGRTKLILVIIACYNYSYNNDMQKYTPHPFDLIDGGKICTMCPPLLLRHSVTAVSVGTRVPHPYMPETASRFHILLHLNIPETAVIEMGVLVLCIF